MAEGDTLQIDGTGHQAFLVPGGITNPMITPLVIATTEDPTPDSSLELQALAGQAGALVLAKDSEAVQLFNLSAIGEAVIRGPVGAPVLQVYTAGGAGPLLNIGTTLVNITVDPDGVGPGVSIDGNGLNYVNATAVSLFSIASDDNIYLGNLFNILPAGHPTVYAAAAPADGDLAAGQVALYFDSTNGAAKLKIKGKSADGTVVSGEVALT